MPRARCRGARREPDHREQHAEEAGLPAPKVLDRLAGDKGKAVHAAGAQRADERSRRWALAERVQQRYIERAKAVLQAEAAEAAEKIGEDAKPGLRAAVGRRHLDGLRAAERALAEGR